MGSCAGLIVRVSMDLRDPGEEFLRAGSRIGQAVRSKDSDGTSDSRALAVRRLATAWK
ncbi:hypothetical protein J2S59_001530 [Nocardioides massiliensis]|uniref:Uncharacterized protein n=1 Tax=Nocardioides massiliensis TaxID=1325935 RepID=A0ABT9NMS2_9ACTN|nr:hypothetical protein [Nocardioides massiliensis]